MANTVSWGRWHTGPDVPGPCVQELCWHTYSSRHTLDEAVRLNEKEREFKRALMWARHKTWVGDGS